jgi:hypothetical protein
MISVWNADHGAGLFHIDQASRYFAALTASLALQISVVNNTVVVVPIALPPAALPVAGSGFIVGR